MRETETDRQTVRQTQRAREKGVEKEMESRKEKEECGDRGETAFFGYGSVATWFKTPKQFV